MWTVFLVVLVIVGLCVLGLGVNVLFLKKDFPKYDVGSNEEMQRLGIRCYKDEDAELQGKTCTGKQSEACKDCNFYSGIRRSEPANDENIHRHSGHNNSHSGLDPESQTA